MKSFAVTLTTLLFATTTFAHSFGEISFSPRSPYNPKQKAMLIKSLHTYCPVLFDGNHRANFVEVSTTITKRRVDQNMFDTVFTTVFHYETNEAGRFDGTVTFMGEIDYNRSAIAGFALVGDSNKVCAPVF